MFRLGRLGVSWNGTERSGVAGNARRGEGRQGRHLSPYRGGAGKATCGEDGRGQARYGRHGSAG
jgi:hypothetical protein